MKRSTVATTVAAIVLAALALAATAACRVDPPVAPNLEVPSDGAQVCASHCATMGLGLGGVVLVANRMGCVCTPMAPMAPGAPGMSVIDGGGAAAALSMIVDDEQAAAAQQQQRQRQAAQPRPR